MGSSKLQIKLLGLCGRLRITAWSTKILRGIARKNLGNYEHESIRKTMSFGHKKSQIHSKCETKAYSKAKT